MGELTVMICMSVDKHCRDALILSSVKTGLLGKYLCAFFMQLTIR